MLFRFHWAERSLHRCSPTFSSRDEPFAHYKFDLQRNLFLVSRNLVTILHSNPPGNGIRTLQRVDLARDTLGCDTYSVANLYPKVLANSNALSFTTDVSAWTLGRESIVAELTRADTTDVLLGFGVQLPSGEQRQHYRQQLSWLADRLNDSKIRVWAFGGRPTHPSRWHRHVHRHAPGSSVGLTVQAFLAPYVL